MMSVKWRVTPALLLPCLMAACGSPVAETGVFSNELTVTGCLRGGEQAGTYVVTADSGPLPALGGRTVGSPEMPTYTYVLEGTRDVSEFVGHRVEVTGEVTERDEFEHERATQTEAEAHTRPGDTFTPMVETEEHVTVRLRALEVREIRSLSPTCPPGAGG
jgi:hypothetical protein